MSGRTATVAGGSTLQSGRRSIMRARTAVVSSPSNGRVPVNISNSTQPKAQVFVRLSAARPFACGLI